MYWKQKIREAREAQKLSRAQLANNAQAFLPQGQGISAASLVKWETDSSEPSVTQAIALARALGFREVSDLFGYADGLQLNLLGTNRLEEYRSLLLQSDKYCNRPAAAITRLLPVFLQPASAGTGQWLDDGEAENIEVDDSVPQQAQFGVKLAGDSMEPRFANGQIVWAKRQEDANNGDIVLCYLNGQSYCKKLWQDEDGVRLNSLNHAYKPIVIAPEDDFRVFGVVVG